MINECERSKGKPKTKTKKKQSNVDGGGQVSAIQVEFNGQRATTVRQKLVRSSTSSSSSSSNKSERRNNHHQVFNGNHFSTTTAQSSAKKEQNETGERSERHQQQVIKVLESKEQPLILVDAPLTRRQHEQRRRNSTSEQKSASSSSSSSSSIDITTHTANNNNNRNNINTNASNNNSTSSSLNQQASRDSFPIHNVDDVKKHFIALINHNQLQYLYLGSLLFSLLIIGYVSAQLTLISSSNNKSHQQTQLLNTLNLANDCRLKQDKHWLLKPISHANLWLLLALAIGLTIALVLVTAFTTLQFGEKLHHQQQKNDNNNNNTNSNKPTETENSSSSQWLSRQVKSLGVALALLLLYLPFVLPKLSSSLSITNDDQQQQQPVNLYNQTENCQQSTPLEDAASWLSPVGALLLLIYLQPFYLNSVYSNSSTTTNATDEQKTSITTNTTTTYTKTKKTLMKCQVILSSCLCLLLPIGVTLLTILVTSTLQEYTVDGKGNFRLPPAAGIVVLICGSPLALLMGYVKWQTFERTVAHDTFSGANSLIEAKISLEHQRQQQETLLLSVLPAYVAEQVKRNMLKKTTTVLVSSSSNDKLSARQEYHHLHHHQQHHHQHQNVTSLSIGGASTSSAGGIRAGSFQQQATIDEQQQQLCKRQQSATDLSTATTTPTKAPLSPRLQVTPASGCNSRFASGTNSSTLNALQLKINCQQANSSGGGAQQAVSSAPPTSAATVAPSGLIMGSSLAASSVSNLTPSHQLASSRRGFNELYIRTYNNVSLLYGDIVGFTRLCTQLSSSQLVRVLNDLFSHFDYLADKHKIMRIKILGDCYYGVSGIPEFAVMGAKSRSGSRSADNHATNCVNMGLDMIHYIRCLNIERASKKGTIGGGGGCVGGQHAAIGSSCMLSHSLSATNDTNICCQATTSGAKSPPAGAYYEQHDEQVNNINYGSKSVGSCTPLPPFELNMRIGIHTGHIHSGVIGLKKWQFDVWSNDVSIAMHCESSGIAGRVQVTEATVQHLNGAFTFENSQGCKRDIFLASKDIKTYLICDRVASLGVDLSRFGQDELMQIENNKSKIEKKKKQQRRSTNNCANKRDALDEDNIRAATIGTIRQTLLAGETCNSSALNSYGLAFNHQDMRPVTLSYRDSTISKLYSISQSGNKINNDNNNNNSNTNRDNNTNTNNNNTNKNNDGILIELLANIVFLVIVYPIISSHLLLPKSVTSQYFNTIILVVLSVGIILLLLSLLPTNHHHYYHSHSRMTNEVGIKKFSTSKLSIRQAQILNEASFFNLDHNQYDQSKQSNLSSTACNYQQVIKDKQCEKNWFTHKLDLLILFRKQISNLYQHLVDVIRLFIGNVIVLNKKTTSFITILMFTSVILMQCYLINYYHSQHQQNQLRKELICNDNDILAQLFKMKTRELLSIEQFQLTVIILLVTIDFNTNLISYKTKCILILSTLGIQFLFYVSRLSASNNQQHQLHYTNCTTSIGFNITRQSTVLSNNNSIGPHDKQLSTIGQQLDLLFDLPYLINQQLIDWSSAALIFVVSLWSLAFARQVEYINKANFLWRNRLNVDHEELEYISGINKVLLENILPSHVVQYYLTHPNGQQNANKLPILQPYMRMSKFIYDYIILILSHA